MSNNHPPPENSTDMNASVAGQIGQAIQSGLPIESGLRALAGQTHNHRIKLGLLSLADRLEEGVPLASAMRDAEFVLPRGMRALVDAGVQTGRLDALMQYSIGQSRRSAFLKQQIWLALSYPVFILWFAFMYCLGVLQFLVPMFVKIFDDFGTELPGLTLSLISMSRITNMVFSSEWHTFLFRLGVLLLLTFFLFMMFSRWARNNSSMLPIVGRSFRFAALSDFCQIMAVLLETGLPMSRAILTAGSACDDRWLDRRCQLMANDIESGTIAETAARKAGMPNTVVQVFRSAGTTSSATEALRGLSDIYSAQSGLSANVLTSMIGPAAMVVVALFVGMTVLALFMPLIKLLNDLS